MWKTYLDVVCRTAAELKQPPLEPLSTQERDPALPRKGPEATARSDVPPSASDAEVLGDRDAAGISEPSSHPETSPPDLELMDTTRPKASAPGRSNEVPVGLIEDDLLSAELCNESVDSLRHVYKHFKVMPLCLLNIMNVCMSYTFSS